MPHASCMRFRRAIDRTLLLIWRAFLLDLLPSLIFLLPRFSTVDIVLSLPPPIKPQYLALAAVFLQTPLVTAESTEKIWSVFAYTLYGDSTPAALAGQQPGGLSEYGASQLVDVGSSFRYNAWCRLTFRKRCLIPNLPTNTTAQRRQSGCSAILQRMWWQSQDSTWQTTTPFVQDNWPRGDARGNSPLDSEVGGQLLG